MKTTPTPTPAKHSELPVLVVAQSIGYPHPVILRAKESADGQVKIATVHHTASYSAQKLASQIVTACNSFEAMVEALRVAIVGIPEIRSHGDYYQQAIIAQLRSALALAEGKDV